MAHFTPRQVTFSRYPLLNTRYAEGLIQSQGQGPMPIQTQVTCINIKLY